MKKKLKERKYLWYNAESDTLFELDFEATTDIITMMIGHTLNFNVTMLYLGIL